MSFPFPLIDGMWHSFSGSPVSRSLYPFSVSRQIDLVPLLHFTPTRTPTSKLMRQERYSEIKSWKDKRKKYPKLAAIKTLAVHRFSSDETIASTSSSPTQSQAPTLSCVVAARMFAPTSSLPTHVHALLFRRCRPDYPVRRQTPRQSPGIAAAPSPSSSPLGLSSSPLDISKCPVVA